MPEPSDISGKTWLFSGGRPAANTPAGFEDSDKSRLYSAADKSPAKTPERCSSLLFREPPNTDDAGLEGEVTGICRKCFSERSSQVSDWDEVEVQLGEAGTVFCEDRPELFEVVEDISTADDQHLDPFRFTLDASTEVPALHEVPKKVLEFFEVVDSISTADDQRSEPFRSKFDASNKLPAERGVPEYNRCGDSIPGDLSTSGGVLRLSGCLVTISSETVLVTLSQLDKLPISMSSSEEFSQFD